MRELAGVLEQYFSGGEGGEDGHSKEAGMQCVAPWQERQRRARRGCGKASPVCLVSVQLITPLLCVVLNLSFHI